MKIDLSIIIVSYNNRELLKNCLNSIYENVSGKVNYEIFVVDNNSADHSVQMLQELFPAVKIIDNQENVGFARANNQAMKLAQGRYFVLLNNDTFVLQKSFENMISFLDKKPEVGAASPRLLNGDGLTTQLQGSKNSKKIWDSTAPIPVKFISGAAFFMRKKTYDNIGGLDEHFFFYNEDLDWCKRVLQNNWQIYYYPDSLVIHYGGQSSKLVRRKTLVAGIKGGLYFCYKHYRPFVLLYSLLIFLYALIEIVLNTIKLIFFKNKKNSYETIAGFSEILVSVILMNYK